jgi:hypothetical protein
VGFPIRKCPDQSLFAAPRTLSQRTTSFIASQRQGIHRIPLRHLIVLMNNARPFPSLGSDRSPYLGDTNLVETAANIVRKTSFCLPNTSGCPSGQARQLCSARALGGVIRAPNMFSLYDVKYFSQSGTRAVHTDVLQNQTRKLLQDDLMTTGASSDRSTTWWSQTGSNRRPHACKARALPTELWPHSSGPQVAW